MGVPFSSSDPMPTRLALEPARSTIGHDCDDGNPSPSARALVGHSTRPTVANAERTYVDPSALRSLYLHDDRSRRVCAWRARLRGSLPITRHGYGELVNSIA